MILIIDNYDSFVYNLARYVRRLGYETHVRRNDEITISEIKDLKPLGIILSPGPCTPNEAGICLSLIKELSGKVPILGVCLGHQAIAQAFGGNVETLSSPIHGMSDSIMHNGDGLFKDIDHPMTAGRYHSLIVDLDRADKLTATAQNKDGIIMALQHDNHPTYGVQFHPESVLTPQGNKIIENFLNSLSDKRITTFELHEKN